MKTLDLHKAIPDTLSMLEDRGEQASVSAVLEMLGVALAPTLRHGGADEFRPTPGEEGLVSLGRFQLLGELGRGGMGRVLEAHDPEICRTVAVKVVVDPAVRSDKTDSVNSRQEGEPAGSSITHPPLPYPSDGLAAVLVVRRAAPVAKLRGGGASGASPGEDSGDPLLV